MDYEKLARINNELAQTPPEWSEAELAALLHAAAEDEIQGHSIAEQHSYLAAYLRLHPEVGEEYQMLVWLLREERDQKVHLPSIVPRWTGLPGFIDRQPDRDPLPAQYILPPRHIHFGYSVVRKGSAQVAETAQREEQHDIPDLGMRMRVRLRVQEDLGSIYLKLMSLVPTSPVDFQQTTVRLYAHLGEDSAAVWSYPPIEETGLDARQSVLFSGLDVGSPYYLVLTLATSQPVIVHIEADFWPRL